MVQVQKAVSESGQASWMLLGNDYLPVAPVQDFLAYLQNVGRSPNTIRSYAFHLKLYWEYLAVHGLDWQSVGVVELADFMMWLRVPSHKDVISMQEQQAKRTEATVNAILTAVHIHTTSAGSYT